MVTSEWPYAPFPDPQWLGGTAGEDAALAAVVRTLRKVMRDAGDPVDGRPETLLVALRRLAEVADRIDWATLSLVGEARAHRVPWSRIGTALGVSKQAVQHRFAPYVTEALQRAGQPPQRR